MSSTNVFIDYGFEDEIFRQQFISQEFAIQALRELASTSVGKNAKEALVEKVIKDLRTGQLTMDDILLNYVKRPRMWLSFKLGQYTELPKDLNPASQLIDSFGDDGWYGPVLDQDSDKAWLIRIHQVTELYYVGIGEARQTAERKYRWTVVAELSSTHTALSWYGFTFSGSPGKQGSQFQFWSYIPSFFEELAGLCKANWDEPDLYRLVLDKLWQKYNNSALEYLWRHIRIRAESSGVALNASSSGIVEIDIDGLTVLSRRLAAACMEAMGTEPDLFTTPKVEEAITKTLIRGWGAKSYEFILEKKASEHEKKKGLFRAHCYFGRNSGTRGEDSFPHLKCYSEYGNSLGALEFLLRELKILT